MPLLARYPPIFIDCCAQNFAKYPFPLFVYKSEGDFGGYKLICLATDIIGENRHYDISPLTASCVITLNYV